MKRYIDFGKEVLIPIQIVEVAFCEKEEISLSAFQNFILEAIELGNGINQIVEATLLTKNVVETEIVQMISQKLLVQDEETVSLSELSKKILMIARCVRSLNREKKYVCINLMTGDIEAFENEKMIDYKDDSSLFLFPKISERDIDGISLEENTSFFGNYMDSFAEMNENDIETVLASVFVEFKAVGKRKFMKKVLSKIPCAIGGEVIQSKGENPIIAKGLLYKIGYEVESEIVKSNQSVLSELITINNKDSDLISDKGHHVLELHEKCMNYNRQSFICFYDAISGRFQFEPPKDLISRKMKFNFQLPLLNDISAQAKECIINELRERYNIIDDFSIKEVFCEDEYYSIECELFDLWRDGNA